MAFTLTLPHEPPAGAAELLELTALASRTATRGEKLVRSLFDLAEPHPPEGDPIDLTEIAREAAELSRGNIDEGVTIGVEAPDRDEAGTEFLVVAVSMLFARSTDQYCST